MLRSMAKPDPRADPMSNPPTAKDDFSVDHVGLKVPGRPRLPSSPEDVPAAVAPTPVAGAGASAGAGAAPGVAVHVEALERLLDANDWKKVGAELGALEDLDKLPPNLALVAALAHNENAKDGEPAAVTSAIRSLAKVLGVAEDSPIARVLARRMLRKNPVRFSERKAPPARTSLLIVVATLIVGSGVGWLASIGSWRGIAALVHL
jgi:hypothetical protein